MCPDALPVVWVPMVPHERVKPCHMGQISCSGGQTMSKDINFDHLRLHHQTPRPPSKALYTSPTVCPNIVVFCEVPVVAEWWHVSWANHDVGQARPVGGQRKNRQNGPKLLLDDF